MKNKSKTKAVEKKELNSPYTVLHLGVEVVRVFPVYQKLSKKKKRNILELLKVWVNYELSSLPATNKKPKK